MSESMGEAQGARYWCHMCSQIVSPIMEVELKCPYCDGGFVEEMDGSEGGGELDSSAADLSSDRALSLWAPILLGMMGGPSRRRRIRINSETEDPESEERDNVAVLRRRRRNTAIMQLLHTLQDGTQTETANPDTGRDRERVILINPYNQAVILGTSNNTTDSSRIGGGTTLGDYYVGPGLDALLQHLAENDPNKYGTPPARKETVEGLPKVNIEGMMSCSVCLEDFECGAVGREMPCKHKFHDECIMPWLELHSSCPVCRYQLPVEESKDSGGGGGRTESGGGDGGDSENGRRFWVPVPWPFNGLFSFSGNQNGGSSSSGAPRGSSREDGNQN